MNDVEIMTINSTMEEVAAHLWTRGEKDAGPKRLLHMALPLVRAKAIFKPVPIESKVHDGIVLDGLHFRSRILRVHAEALQTVYPYILTIGKGIEEEARRLQGSPEGASLDRIGNAALEAVRKRLEDRLRSEHGLKITSYMSPGSLTDWPVEQQVPLFSLLGDVEGAAGVGLGPDHLMSPVKSTSGIYFSTEEPFFSCMLCPQERCPGRKSAYDERKVKQYVRIDR